MFEYDYASPMYQPAVRNIIAITQAQKAQVTTDIAHSYVTGTIIRLFIPLGFGMQQANQLFAQIFVNPASPTTFLIDIDTRLFDAFVLPPLQPLPPPNQTVMVQHQQAQASPYAEISTTLAASERNVLPYP